jgi:hypothetical protein
MTPEEIEIERIRIEQKKLEIEEARAAREARFFRANMAIIITALVSVATLVASGWQFLHVQGREWETHSQNSQARLDDQRMKILEYLSRYRDGIFSSDPKIREQYRTIMLIGIPRDPLIGVFEQLRQTQGGDRMWVVGKIVYEWRPVGTGDCSGRDVSRSDGLDPATDRCDATFEDRIAICWDGGSFRNGASKWCTYKSVTPETCTGGSARGYMHQCVRRVVSEEDKSKLK